MAAGKWEATNSTGGRERSKRFAGFQVLRAPDVPSVLVEIGYLSNQDDEKLMLDPVWRDHVAERLAAAVSEFAQMKTVRALN